ncbi:hypothetical protein SNEBB_007751 [Seison nebaliae]|nr:hypothetical protein SNEBB_007751 [Seison nebaliae]
METRNLLSELDEKTNYQTTRDSVDTYDNTVMDLTTVTNGNDSFFGKKVGEGNLERINEEKENGEYDDGMVLNNLKISHKFPLTSDCIENGKGMSRRFEKYQELNEEKKENLVIDSQNVIEKRIDELISPRATKNLLVNKKATIPSSMETAKVFDDIYKNGENSLEKYQKFSSIFSKIEIDKEDEEELKEIANESQIDTTLYFPIERSHNVIYNNNNNNNNNNNMATISSLSSSTTTTTSNNGAIITTTMSNEILGEQYRLMKEELSFEKVRRIHLGRKNEYLTNQVRQLESNLCVTKTFSLQKDELLKNVDKIMKNLIDSCQKEMKIIMEQSAQHESENLSLREQVEQMHLENKQLLVQFQSTENKLKEKQTSNKELNEEMKMVKMEGEKERKFSEKLLTDEKKKLRLGNEKLRNLTDQLKETEMKLNEEKKKFQEKDKLLIETQSKLKNVEMNEKKERCQFEKELELTEMKLEKEQIILKRLKDEESSLHHEIQTLQNKLREALMINADQATKFQEEQRKQIENENMKYQKRLTNQMNEMQRAKSEQLKRMREESVQQMERLQQSYDGKLKEMLDTIQKRSENVETEVDNRVSLEKKELLKKFKHLLENQMKSTINQFTHDNLHDINMIPYLSLQQQQQQQQPQQQQQQQQQNLNKQQLLSNVQNQLNNMNVDELSNGMESIDSKVIINRPPSKFPLTHFSQSNQPILDHNDNQLLDKPHLNDILNGKAFDEICGNFISSLENVELKMRDATLIDKSELGKENEVQQPKQSLSIDSHDSTNPPNERHLVLRSYIEDLLKKRTSVESNNNRRTKLTGNQTTR